MSSAPPSFHESNLWSTPIRDLGLTIEGTRLGQGFPANREDSAIVALTTLVAGLAMNHVQRGSYLP